MQLYRVTTHSSVVFSYLYCNTIVCTNTNTMTVPGAMDVETSVDDLYADINLKVDATSCASSPCIE